MKVKTESMKVKTESMKVKTESIKVKIESIKVKIESIKVKIESIKVKTECTHVKSESVDANPNVRRGARSRSPAACGRELLGGMPCMNYLRCKPHFRRRLRPPRSAAKVRNGPRPANRAAAESTLRALDCCTGTTLAVRASARSVDSPSTSMRRPDLSTGRRGGQPSFCRRFLERSKREQRRGPRLHPHSLVSSWSELGAC